MNRTVFTWVSLLLALLLWSSAARGIPPDLSGYWKSYATVISLETGGADTLPPLGAVSNTLRLEAKWRPVRWCRFSAVYSLSPRVQDPALFQEGVLYSGFRPFIYRADDLRSQLYPCPGDSTGSFGVLQNLDRLLIELRPEFADIYLGRQAISWGSARVVSPTDFIAPYAFNELDAEDRIGIDAIRFRVPVGMLSELDGGVILGEDLETEQSAAYLRGRFYIAETDVAILTAAYRENLLIGLDLSRAIGGASGWLEAAWVGAGTFSDEQPGNQSFFRGTIGADYSWSGSIYGFIEYHYNSAGATDRMDYPSLFDDPAYQTGGVYLLGKHYFCPGISWQASPLFTVTGQLLINPTDQSAYLMATGDYSVAQNVYLQAGLFMGDGLNRNEQQAGPATDFDEAPEFEAYPDIFFTSFGVYF